MAQITNKPFQSQINSKQSAGTAAIWRLEQRQHITYSSHFTAARFLQIHSQNFLSVQLQNYGTGILDWSVLYQIVHNISHTNSITPNLANVKLPLTQKLSTTLK